MSDCPDCTDLATQITEAKAALHQLMLGRQRASVTFGAGKRVEYTQATRADLQSYIGQLQATHDACCATSATTRRRGMIRMVF